MDRPPKTPRKDSRLPPTGKFLLRHAGFPLLRMALSWERALWLFEKDAYRILQRVADISTLQRHSPVTVRPLLGLGESARRWSVAATLEHLLWVGQVMSERIVGIKSEPSVIATRYASPYPSVDVRHRYETFVHELARRLRAQGGPCGPIHPHRWLGPVDAHGWLVLLAIHQFVHRRQVDEITKALACD